MARWREALARLAGLDRRVIYAVLVAAVIVPFYCPLGFRVIPTEGPRRFYDAVDRAARSGKPVLVSVDFGPDTEAENGQMLRGVLDHVFSRHGRVVAVTFQPTGGGIAERYLAEAGRGRVYGRDYVFLGYKPSPANVMLNLGRSFRLDFATDGRGTSLDRLPLMAGVQSTKDIALVVAVANNAIPRFWIQYATGPDRVPLVAGLTGTMAPQFYPYLQAGQLRAILAGMQEAAEYEALLREAGLTTSAGLALQSMDSQSLAHAAIVVFILLGNLGFLASRRRR